MRGPWVLRGSFPFATLGGWLILALVLVALASWAWRRWRRRERPVEAPQRLEPAEVVAHRRLAELPALLDAGEQLRFHVELADIVKGYLSRRYDADLLERTTDEVRRLFKGTLRDRPNARGVRDDVGRVLGACDLVKFARDVTERGEALRLIEKAESIVDRTTVPEEPVEVGEAA